MQISRSQQESLPQLALDLICDEKYKGGDVVIVPKKGGVKHSRADYRILYRLGTRTMFSVFEATDRMVYFLWSVDLRYKVCI